MLGWLLNGMGGQNELACDEPRQTNTTATDANPHKSDWQGHNSNELWLWVACCERQNLYQAYGGVRWPCIAIENSTMTPSSETTPAD